MSASVRSRAMVPSASAAATDDGRGPADDGTGSPRRRQRHDTEHHPSPSPTTRRGSRRLSGGQCARGAPVALAAAAGLFALLASSGWLGGGGGGGSGTTPTTTTETETAQTDKPPRLSQVFAERQRREEQQRQQRQDDRPGEGTGGRNGGETPSKMSALVASAADNVGGPPDLDDCGIAIHSIDSPEASSGAGSRAPVLLRGRGRGGGGGDVDIDIGDDGAAAMNWTDVDAFFRRFGQFRQYVKDATVQPRRRRRGGDSSREELCAVPGVDLWNHIASPEAQSLDPLWFFTNDRENGEFLDQIRPRTPPTPEYLNHVDGFDVFSALTEGGYHSFHRHGESWIGQLSGSKMWWFLPPDTGPQPSKVDACGYLRGAEAIPEGAVRCLQRPGDVIWFPKDWYHATCALDEWTVGVGAQVGPLIRQEFPPLDRQRKEELGEDEGRVAIEDCLGVRRGVDEKGSDGAVAGANGHADSGVAKAAASMVAQTGPKKDKKPEKDGDDWTWFDGDINAYYNSLERDHRRNPTKINDYAVHRWMGPTRSTEIHYRLLHSAVARHLRLPESGDAAEGGGGGGRALDVLDAGCGLGSALMWLEGERPGWNLVGHTLSEEQQKFAVEKLPPHNFRVELRSYDDIDDGKSFDVIYSIEAAIHSPDIRHSLSIWAKHLSEDGGVVVLIDDFLQAGVDAKNDEEIDYFRRSWLANSLVTTTQLHKMGREFGLTLVEDRDLGSEYRINEINYGNRLPAVKVDGNKSHQGWLGSKMRQRLMILGKLTYRMVVLQRGEPPKKPPPPSLSANTASLSTSSLANCPSVPAKENDGDPGATFTEITPQLMSGVGKAGGDKMACISGWYCCDKGLRWYDDLEEHRTDSTQFLKLPRELFERHYVDVFADRLNEHYRKYPSLAGGGRFLDIGGTGSTASGMTQVTSKFQHFAGPLEYWKLDSDPAAKKLERSLYCDVDDCPAAEDCAFDVTFSHTVLEHARRPWKSFDTVARITKRGGLTLHLVPFSYQYHATPEDNFRFSHTALASLVEDRGFEVLDLGYDVCTKPDAVLRSRRDEHYDTIWLTYVVARKL